MADYANEKGCTTAYVYGHNDASGRTPHLSRTSN